MIINKEYITNILPHNNGIMVQMVNDMKYLIECKNQSSVLINANRFLNKCEHFFLFEEFVSDIKEDYVND